VHAFTASKTASCVIAAKRACANGFCAAMVVSMIRFQSITTSARAVKAHTKESAIA
jgi:hypothetical protein